MKHNNPLQLGLVLFFVLLSFIVMRLVAAETRSAMVLGLCLGLAGSLMLWGVYRLQQQHKQQRVAKQLTSLGQMGRTVTSSLDLDSVLQTILNEVPALIKAEGVGILLLEEQELVFKAISGPAAEGLQGYRMPANAGIAGQVVQAGESVWVHGPKGRQQIYKQAEAVSGYVTQSLLAVPLRFSGQMIGVLEAVHSSPFGFSDEDLHMLEDAANWAAIAIQNARHYQQAQMELTVRRRAEAALRESEKRYRTLTEVSPVGVFHTDPNGRYLYVNGRWRTITGISIAEAVGQLWYVTLPIHEAPAVAVAWKMTAADKRPFSYEFRLKKQIGQETIWVQVDMVPELNTDRQLVGYVGILTDATERKQAEIFRRYAHKLESLGIFAGGIAHGFNNLLVTMLGQAAVAQLKAGNNSPAYRHIGEFAQAAEEAARLTQQMLTYSGRYYMQNQRLSLNTLAQQLCRQNQVLFPAHIQLVVELDPQLPLIEGDKIYLEQLLQSLLDNAREAVNDKKPGIVRVETGTQEIAAEDDYLWHYTGFPLRPGHYCLLTVQDNGEGIAEDILPNIFDPFFTTRFNGRGLGLAAVLGIVRAHKGGINVIGQPGKGTIFEIVFPTAAVETQLPLADINPVPASSQ